MTPHYLAQDPADSIFRLGMAAIRQDDFHSAAGIFVRLRELHPTSGYVPDAYYFEAFALSRVGGMTNLRTADSRLTEHLFRFPEHRTRSDAAALQARVRGELARGGDPVSARDVAVIAGSGRAAIGTGAGATGSGGGSRGTAIIGGGAATSTGTGTARGAGGGGTTTTAPRAGSLPRGTTVIGSAVGGVVTTSPVARGNVRPHETLPQGCEEEEVRIAALSALQSMDPEQTLPVLNRILQRTDRCAGVLRRQAVFILARNNSPEAADIMLRLAREDADPEVRGHAIFWLARVNTPAAFETIRGILLDSSEASFQEQALFALHQRSDAQSLALLREFASRQDVQHGLRQSAIHKIGQSPSRENTEFLRTLFGREESQSMKEQILHSLAQQKDLGNDEWLLRVALDEKETSHIRSQALYWAGRGGAPLPQLIQLYDRVTEREMKEQLLHVFSQRKEPEALDKMIAIARTEKDRELRTSAILWLGRSGDPRARAVLLEIIGG